MNSVDKRTWAVVQFALKWAGTSLILWLASTLLPISLWFLAIISFVIAVWMVVILREKLLEDLTTRVIRLKKPLLTAYLLAPIAMVAVFYLTSLLMTLMVQFGVQIYIGRLIYIWNFIQYMLIFKYIVTIGEQRVFRQYSSKLSPWLNANLLGTLFCAGFWGYYAYQTIQVTPALTGWWFMLYSPTNFTGVFWIAGGLIVQGFFDGLGIASLEFKAKEPIRDESVQAWQRPRNLGTL